MSASTISWTPESLEGEIDRRLREAAGNNIRYQLKFEPTNALAFLTPPNAFVEFVSDAIEAETGIRPKLSTTGGTSDARFIVNECPGGRVRPRGPDDAPDRRAGGRGRSRSPGGDLSENARSPISLPRRKAETHTITSSPGTNMTGISLPVSIGNMSRP